MHGTIKHMAVRITARDLADMTRHHLRCPPNGYLGSGYGSDVKAILQTPMAAGLADGIIAKAQQDVPLLRTAAPGSVNLYASDLGMDKKGIFLEIGGELIPVDGGTKTIVQDDAPVVSVVPALIDTVSEAAADLLDTLTNVTLPSQDYF